MLVILGHNPLGNVIHMIVGPETEMFTDIHGSKIIDITDMLKACEQNQHVFLSLTRCKAEGVTEAMLRASNIPHFNTFAGLADAGGGIKSSVTDSKQKEETKATAKATKDRCTYCKRETDLLPIPGYKICAVCAQIELGLLKKKSKDTAS